MRVTEQLEREKKKCSGCAACLNSCPVNAITMVEDEEGFLIPSIDETKCISCGKCVNACTQLFVDKPNTVNPRCFAIRMEEDILKRSSSGGAFSALAYYALGQGGVVCGAAFDEDFRGVSHIIVDNADDLSKLRGSKYVYSKTGDIYIRVKEYLAQNRFVLFCGTPCQVAALYRVVGRQNEKLLTVDLLCGGVPSEKIYRTYLDSFSQGKEISGVRFRPKEYGWDYSGIETSFSNGTIHMRHSVKDSYLRGFLNWLFVGNACENCEYAEPGRQGDFTIGDFWNADRFSNMEKYTDGVSTVLVNNEKATRLFPIIFRETTLCKEMPLAFLKRYNRVQKHRKAHLARQRFFDLLNDGMPFDKAVDYCLGWKFDVAITGCWTVKNYGGAMTYYALYHLIKDMGYTAIMVERRANIPHYDVPVQHLFQSRVYPFYDVSRIHKSMEEQKELNNRVRNFVVGSDQIWNYRFMSEESIESYSFDYVSDWNKRIAYGSSFGTLEFTGTDDNKKKFNELIQKFDYISCREQTGVNLLLRDFGVKSEWNIDPVFLCDRKYYDSLVKNVREPIYSDYLFTYILHPNSFKKGFENIAKEKNLDIRSTLDAALDKTYIDNWAYSFLGNLSVEKWLFYLSNSRYVVTDSFHAVCFAILYRIDFVFIKGRMDENYGLDRLLSLLTPLGLTNRMYESVQEACQSEIIQTPIDYEKVYEILNPLILRGRKWLQNALEADMSCEPKRIVPLKETQQENGEPIDDATQLAQALDELAHIKNTKSWRYTQYVRDLLGKLK